MTKISGRSLALGAVVIAACSFGTNHTWVTVSNSQHPWQMGLTMDGTHLFVFDTSIRDLQLYTPGVDLLEDDLHIAAWSDAPSELSPDPVNTDRILALQTNGYIQTHGVDATTATS